MQLPPQLTTDDRRLIRNWSVGMLIIYSLLLVGVLALATLADTWTSAGDTSEGTAPHINALRASD